MSFFCRCCGSWPPVPFWPPVPLFSMFVRPLGPQSSFLRTQSVAHRFRWLSVVNLLLTASFLYIVMFNSSLLTNGQEEEIRFPKPLNHSLSPNKLVNIFTFQKNEGKLMLEWGAWHGSIFGFDALHIIDHQSDDPQTIFYLNMLASKGAHIETYSGKFQHKASQLTKWMASSEAKFLVPIDVDEFLILVVNNSLLLDSNEILNTFRYLPVDGRRYKPTSILASYCPSEHDTNTRSWKNFSRPQEMTVFKQAPIHLECSSMKTFYLRSSFLGTDQGNHYGSVVMDKYDANYRVNGCPYFHSPSIGLVHYGYNLPWSIQRDKLMRGANVYNHTGRLAAGQQVCSGHGAHYCGFWKKFLEIGEEAMQAEHENNKPCTSNSTFTSEIISEGIRVALSQIPLP